MKKIDEVTLLPDLYFKGHENYEELWRALVKCFPQHSRNLPDTLTMAMSDICASGVHFQPHIPHWHQISGDEDERSLRNLLQSDGAGRPKRQSRNIDLLRYIDMCLQYTDLNYRQYVMSWCLEQAFDEEEDF